MIVDHTKVVIHNVAWVWSHAAAVFMSKQLTLVYFVAAKMSSNFFFRVWPSDSGQLLSS